MFTHGVKEEKSGRGYDFKLGNDKNFAIACFDLLSKC